MPGGGCLAGRLAGRDGEALTQAGTVTRVMIASMAGEAERWQRRALNADRIIAGGGHGGIPPAGPAHRPVRPPA
jgi:hypothetical protein